MATQAASSKKESGTDALDTVKKAGTNLLTDTKAAITDKASTAVDDKKAMLTGGLTSVADSMRKLSGSLGEGEPNVITEYSARYADAAAGKVEDVARYFENADLKTVARDVESFARRNPVVFVGSAFALGLLAARFLKSSSESGSSGQGGGNRTRSSKSAKSSSTATRAAA